MLWPSAPESRKGLPQRIWGYPVRGHSHVLCHPTKSQRDLRHHPTPLRLRGAAAILFISSDTCNDSIAKLYLMLVFMGIAQLSRYMLQNAVSHRCACVKLSPKTTTCLAYVRLPALIKREFPLFSLCLSVYASCSCEFLALLISCNHHCTLNPRDPYYKFHKFRSLAKANRA